MRRMFVVLALLAMMAGLNALKAETSGTDPLTLAAIGFVVLAAFALAELGARASLPKVTGYILSGVVLGPFAANVISTSVVGELKMFSTLALGLIATTAGLELDLKALARLLRTLGTTIAIKMVTGLILVGGALIAYERSTGTLGLGEMGPMIAMALVFAALSLGTSPAIVLAVQTESGAKGRLSEIVLGAAVVKDVVVVVALAIALATSKAILGGGELGGEVLLHLGEELGTSVLAGALLGGLLIAYLRWVKTEMLLFVAAMVLVVAEISAVLHLELLLVFIVAGVVVRNFSEYEHDLLHPLQTISLPVFIVFFTNAGASIDLGATWSVLPLALALCAARAVGYYVAARVGGKAGKEPDTVIRNAWLGYLPQAGVTLGLVGLAAAALPQIAGPIATLGMAVVAVNLLIGPVTLRMALQNAGETSTSDTSEEQPGEVAVSPSADVPVPSALEAPVLRDLLARLHEQLDQSWERWRSEALDESLNRWHSALGPREDEDGTEHGATAARKIMGRIPLEVDDPLEPALHEALAEQVAHLEALPESTQVPLEADNARVDESDPWQKRWAKRFATVTATLRGRRKRRTRRVWTRMSARVEVEPIMARAAEESLRMWHRYEIRGLERIERLARSKEQAAQLELGLEGLRSELLEEMRAQQRQAVAEAVAQLGTRWATAGAPGVGRAARYSNVERELSATVARITADASAWDDRRVAAMQSLGFTTHCEEVQHRVQDRIHRTVLEPLDEAFAGVAVLVQEQRRRLLALPRTDALTDDEAWQRVDPHVRALLPKPAAKSLRAMGTRVRRATSSDSAGAELRAFMAEDTQTVDVVASLDTLITADRPAAVPVSTVNVHELVEVQLAGHVLPQLEEVLTNTSSAFDAVREQMHEVTSLLEFGLETAERNRKADGPTTPFDEAIDRGDDMLETLLQGPCAVWEVERPRLLAAIDDMAQQLRALVSGSAGGDTLRTGAQSMDRWAHLRLRARRFRDELIRRGRDLIRTLRTGEVGQAAGDLALRYRLRAGLQRLDARAISAYLREQRTLRTSKLEGLVGSLFSTEPLRDPRLFVAHREGLAAVLHAERTWQSNPDSGNAALVVGEAGIGKTSLISIARLKLGTRRVLSIREPQATRYSLREALASGLGVANELPAVQQALRKSSSVVVIDDLQRFFPPSPQGLVELEQFVSLIVATQDRTFWLLAMSAEAVRTWQSLVPLDDAFPCRVHLSGIEPASLAAVVDARAALGGQECVYPPPRSLSGRLLRRSPQDAYFRRICGSASGNLRRALALWRSQADPSEGMISLRPGPAISWRLPFVQQLREEVQASLALLLRHGALPLSEVSGALGLSEEQVRVHLRFLVASTLVVREGERYSISEEVIDDLEVALREAGAIEGGS